MDDDIVDDDDFMKRYNEISNSQNSSIHEFEGQIL
jgi:hypothetical protein